jgi:hypothetical protein
VIVIVASYERRISPVDSEEVLLTSWKEEEFSELRLLSFIGGSVNDVYSSRISLNPVIHMAALSAKQAIIAWALESIRIVPQF